MHFISWRWYHLMRSICSADIVWPYQRSTPCSHTSGKCSSISSGGNSSRRECANPHPSWRQDGPCLHSPHRHILSIECGHSADLLPVDSVEAIDSGTADLCEPGSATACSRTGGADAAAPGPRSDRSACNSADQCVYSSTKYTGSKAKQHKAHGGV